MTEPSSWLSLRREAPALLPSIPVEGDMPSMSSGRGSSSSPEVPTTDLLVYCTDELHSNLDTVGQCLVHVQQMPSRRFNNEQCGYLVGKLQVILERATSFLVNVQFSAAVDMTRCMEVFKLLLALAHKIESFVQDCSKDEWLQAAMTLINTTEYVASLGFSLELCQVYFSTGWRAETKALTADQVDNIDRNEVEIVKRMSSVDVDVLLDKVISELPSLQAEDKELGFYLLQRLERLEPVSTSLSPESPFRSDFDDRGFQGRLFQRVRQTEQLGKGASATVHKALWFGVPVAKKTFPVPEHPDYIKETQILRRLCHPNIMSMFGCAMDTRKCSIVMELMDEDLHSFMQRRLDANPHSPPFSVFEAVDVILQIGEGARYLHENGIVHRDLKSSNILVKNILPPDLEVQYVLIKVADFGLSKIKESSTRYSNQTFNTGTTRWMSPEVINLRNTDGQTSASKLQAGPKYPKKSDVYSFGMVCYEILTGNLPFPKESSHINIKKKVLKGERPTLPDYCPSKLKDLIKKCWDPKPTNRPSFGSICSILKHLKFLLMSDSDVLIGEALQMSPKNTPFKAPTREMVVRKRPVQGGLIKSWFTVWRRPLRIFISYAGGPKGEGKIFPSWLHHALKSHRWSSSKFHVKLFLNCKLAYKEPIPLILEGLARFDVGIVVVTPDYFRSRWAMTELIRLVEAQMEDREGRIRILPLFYELTPYELKQGLDQGRWEQSWIDFSTGNHPLPLQECRDAVLRLCRIQGISYCYLNRDEERGYINEILVAVDEILCA